MIEKLHDVFRVMLDPNHTERVLGIPDPGTDLAHAGDDEASVLRALNSAFLISLAGPGHPGNDRARQFLQREQRSSALADVATFYTDALGMIGREVPFVCGRQAAVADQLNGLADWLGDPDNLRQRRQTCERFWSVFFPEAVGIQGNEQESVQQLRSRRTVRITELAPEPLTDPARQMLFTSNVLLTIPSATTDINDLEFSDGLLGGLRKAAAEQQQYWYDHPIQIGVALEKNEVLYGLRGLDRAVAFERERGNLAADARLTCVLSVSVTHRGLQALAREYLNEEFARGEAFNNLRILVFTEADTRQLCEEILLPAAARYLPGREANQLPAILGVDGHYGRHYSFLKAIAAFWQVLIDRRIRATFKIDLDQVFPQEMLVQQSGKSAFEHLTTPLWGGYGVDCDGRAVDLGMIAGALVNEKDIDKSLFTPDVVFGDRELSADELVFFSTLPQALSTAAEMMTRYDSAELDGKTTCLQRIHVTGGTNGILVDRLRRHRPFTPGFIGRAEDQAYILSAFPRAGARLAYVHQPGLIMRHDKEAFAQEAIAAARTGKLVGDYERLLYFSRYARALDPDLDRLKATLNPFTGCFVSQLPLTVAHLRFALKAATMFAQDASAAAEFVRLGARRIAAAVQFSGGQFSGQSDSQLEQTYLQERSAWDLYYDTLDKLETALDEGDAFARQLCNRADEIVRGCVVGKS